ncbi:hypothetical protein D3C78_1266410 [compost metagenome]
MRQHTGQHRQALIAIHQRRAKHRRTAKHRAHTRHHFGLITLGQAIMQVHVGAVEERVALTDHRDIATGVQMRGEFLAGGVVEVADHLLVGQRWRQGLGGHRVHQWQQGLCVLQMRLDDAERIALFTFGHEVRHHRRLAQQAQGLDGNQLRVTGAHAKTDQTSRLLHHSISVARALIAAAAMALPPNRPCMITNGTPRLSAASMALDSAAPTKPTGKPRISAGLGAPASSISSR